MKFYQVPTHQIHQVHKSLSSENRDFALSLWKKKSPSPNMGGSHEEVLTVPELATNWPDLGRSGLCPNATPYITVRSPAGVLPPWRCIHLGLNRRPLSYIFEYSFVVPLGALLFVCTPSRLQPVLRVSTSLFETSFFNKKSPTHYLEREGASPRNI